MEKLDFVNEFLTGDRNISLKTIETYSSLLSTLAKRVNSGIVSFRNNPKLTIQSVVRVYKNINTRATLFSALFILSGLEPYRVEMKAAADAARADYNNQKHSTKRSPTIISYHEIHKINETYLNRAKTSPSIATIVDSLITNIMSGVYPELPPRRLLDYTEMKLDGYDPETDNYYANGTFVFNVYKTAKTEGRVELEVPREIKELISMSVKSLGKREYLLINSYGEKFNSASLYKRLFTIYGFGVDVLRSIFISELHRGTPANKIMEDTAKRMGHSKYAQTQFYVKK